MKDVGKIILAIIVIVIVWKILKGLIGLLERRLLSWRPPSQIEASAA